MPGKRKAPTKSVDTKNKKDAEEAEHKTKATKKTKADKKEEEMEEEIETKTSARTSARSKSKEKASPAKSPSKSPAKSKDNKSKSPKKEKASKDEDSEDDEEEEPSIKKKVGKDKKETEKETKGKKESPKKPAKGKGKKGKDEDKEEEKEDSEDNEKEEVDNKKKGKKAAAPANSKKLNRNRSDLVDTVADDIEDPKFELGDGKIPDSQIVISSWNVAGIKSILGKKTLQEYIKDRKPHILALNETKLTPDTLKTIGTAWVPQGYTSYFNNCKTKNGYSGTAIITLYKPLNVNFGIGIKKHDLEGRTITLEFEHFYLISCYVPNAGEKLVGLDYRTKEWDLDFSAYLNKLKTKKHVILCGDLNVAHKDIDIYETKGKHKFAGFTPEERKGFGDFLTTGFIDTFRHLHPEDQKFSYFSARFPKLKTENKGWRLDYFVIDKEGMRGVKDSLINEKITGSDHLPIELLLNPNFK